MDVPVDFRVLELLCGRLCHELVSPVGAINNGVELLDEEDPEFVKEALGLIAQSARTAGRRLQFYRFAYGTGGGGSIGSGREVALAYFEGGKVRCAWPESADSLAPEWQRLGCNMALLAAELLPRGGAVTVRPRAEAGLEVAAEGEALVLLPELRESLADGTAIDALTARTVHAFYTARLAQQLDAQLTLQVRNGNGASFIADPRKRSTT
jgi:histidine phosphotransferase ChpT